MTKFMHGIVHGKTIELDEEPGVPDGQEVEVQLRGIARERQPCGEGLRRCAGALADDWSEEDDRILEQMYQERKRDTRPEVSE